MIFSSHFNALKDKNIKNYIIMYTDISRSFMKIIREAERKVIFL